MAGRKPIDIDKVKEALDSIKQEHVRKGWAKPIPDARQGQERYSYPKITITAISNRAKCSRSALYKTIEKQYEEDTTDEEIKRGRRLERLLKPFMREPSKPDDIPKPQSKAWMKKEIVRLKEQLSRYDKKLGEFMKQKVQLVKTEKRDDGESEKIKVLQENAKQWHKQVQKLQEENERLREDNAKLRGELMSKTKKV